SPDFLASEIVNGLLAGRYRPGERLAEADLTRAYKVSRSSVREALRRLAAEGVVSLNPYRSAHIRTLSRNELADVLALLEVLAGLAARLAAERIGCDGNRMRLQAALQDPTDTASTHDVAGVPPACDRFFRTLLLVAANRDLARLLPTLQVHLLALPPGSAP